MNTPIDASRSTGIIPPSGGNGLQEHNELPIDQVLSEELPADDKPVVSTTSRVQRKRTTTDELEELKRGKEEAERLLEEKKEELRRFFDQQKNPKKSK